MHYLWEESPVVISDDESGPRSIVTMEKPSTVELIEAETEYQGHPTKLVKKRVSQFTKMLRPHERKRATSVEQTCENETDVESKSRKHRNSMRRSIRIGSPKLKSASFGMSQIDIGSAEPFQPPSRAVPPPGPQFHKRQSSLVNLKSMQRIPTKPSPPKGGEPVNQGFSPSAQSATLPETLKLSVDLDELRIDFSEIPCDDGHNQLESKTARSEEFNRSQSDTKSLSRSVKEQDVNLVPSATSSGSRLTFLTQDSDDFVFDDGLLNDVKPKPPAPASVEPPAIAFSSSPAYRQISTWRPAHLVSRATHATQALSHDLGLYPSDVSREYSYNLGESRRKSIKDVKQLLLCAEASRNATAVPEPTASQTNVSTVANVYEMYHEAINRLNELRILETSRLDERVRQLEASNSKLKAIISELATHRPTLSERTRGLPLMLPVNVYPA